MKLWIGWIITRAMLVAGLWAGFVNGVDGAARIGLFMAWALIVISLFANTKHAIEYKVSNPHPVPPPVELTLQLAVLLFLIWHDALVTAAFWTLHILLLMVAREARKAAARALK